MKLIGFISKSQVCIVFSWLLFSCYAAIVAKSSIWLLVSIFTVMALINIWFVMACIRNEVLSVLTLIMSALLLSFWFIMLWSNLDAYMSWAGYYNAIKYIFVRWLFIYTNNFVVSFVAVVVFGSFFVSVYRSRYILVPMLIVSPAIFVSHFVGEGHVVVNGSVKRIAFLFGVLVVRGLGAVAAMVVSKKVISSVINRYCGKEVLLLK